MENELTKQDELVELEGIKIRRHEIDLIKRTIFIGASDDEMALFFWECRRRGVHPFDRMIYPVVRKDRDGTRRVTFQMGIDYLRAAGEETGRYVGQKPMQYGPTMKQSTVDGEINVPEWAEAVILRKDPESGEIAEIPHKAYWKEFYPGEQLGFMWRKMPMNQLGKCAEAGALRKAFPRKLGGLYINEEMEQAEAVPFIPLKQPQKKNGDVPKGETQKIVTHIVNVIQKDGKRPDKKDSSKIIPYTLYTIFGENDFRTQTFDKKFAEQAMNEKGSAVTFEIEFSKGAYGNDLVALNIIMDENAQT